MLLYDDIANPSQGVYNGLANRPSALSIKANHSSGQTFTFTEVSVLFGSDA
jgi:hypothetical protein